MNIHYVSTLIYKQLSYLKAKQSVKVLQVMEYGEEKRGERAMIFQLYYLAVTPASALARVQPLARWAHSQACW